MYIEVKLYPDNAPDNHNPLMNHACLVSIENFNNWTTEEMYQRRIAIIIERMKGFVAANPDKCREQNAS